MGDFQIKMQLDGNIVMYLVYSPEVANYAYWATSSKFSTGYLCATLTLDNNGSLVMPSTKVRYILHISNSSIPQVGKTYRATMDADGIFWIYSHESNDNDNWSVEWAACATR